jgi:NTP pyrophosphatase (non-canonical NTP hydrolase)
MTDNENTVLRLDDIYKMTAYIYGDRNITRTKEATFSHFVEVCGMLTIHDRRKKREQFDVSDALCKALGWYFPLLAKLRIDSIERLVFRKFPGVCPYCRETPHNEAKCKLVKGTHSTVNHAEVNSMFAQNWESRPSGLNEWQEMFGKIYPRNLNEVGRSTIGLMEELGELAEAIRVFDAHPHYFLGEAADIFSYIMGIANEHQMREAQEDRVFSFETEFLFRYPGLCTQCGSRICNCPSIPAATVGRMAKEINIDKSELIFISDFDNFTQAGQSAAQIALESVGGYPGLAQKLPFDRGDANHGLIQLCLKMAAAVEETTPDLAATLRAEAVKVAESAREAGTPREPLPIDRLLGDLRKIWKELDEQLKAEIKDSGGITSDLAEIFDVVRILFIFCNPDNAGIQLRLHAEQRAIKDALRRGPHSAKFVIEDLPSSTTDDLRRALLENNYDIIHFSGHADETILIFEDEHGKPRDVPISALSELVREYPSVKCVILNACESVKSLSTPISTATIGMDKSIPDDTAIIFSRGFYDALAAGKSIKRAYDEGVYAVKLAGKDSDFIKMVS